MTSRTSETRGEQNLNDLINEAAEEIRSDRVFTEEESSPTASPMFNEEETERKRKELLTLSNDGEIKKSVAFISKASAKVIDKLYAEYEAKRLDESAMFLCDLAISKFSMLMGGLDAIEKPDDGERTPRQPTSQERFESRDEMANTIHSSLRSPVWRCYGR